MATTAIEYKNKGVGIIKIKLGKNATEDVERVRKIREAVGNDTRLRIDANQGWNYQDAEYALCKLADYNIEFCEQPMRYWDDDKLPELKTISPVKIMADESVFSHYDAERLIKAGACDYVNIKFAKSGGILEATKINTVCARHNIKCMMGGMLESRIASTAFAHFAMIHDNIVFYDMDTSLIGHKVDPVTDGVQYNGFMLEVPDLPGLGADVDNKFLNTLEKIVV
jgi:L-alanine-DL-glutamate epimerase-like enolase superfamily enzyme